MVESRPLPHHAALAEVRSARLANDIKSTGENPQFGRGLLYSRCPKDPLENIEHRRWWLDYGRRSRELASDVWLLCKKDILWYVNTFCFTYDPRKEPSKLPFITYEFQDRAILELVDVIQTCRKERIKKRRDIVIEKSRDMGASWLILLVFEWLWHFHNDVQFLMLSRKEELVDDVENPKALFWKIDFLHKNQPGWLLPPMQRLNMKLVNERTGSSITGESTNSNAGRGDRATAVLLDEFAAVENATEILAATGNTSYCRIVNSTPMGAHTEFSKMRRNPAFLKLRMHWLQHPEKSLGAYVADSAGVKTLDGSPIDPRYHYITDGRPRSPWFDSDTAGKDAREVAREYDIDDTGSDHQFFDPLVVDRLVKKYGLPPLRVGHLQYDPLRCRVYESTPMKDSEDGGLRLWCQLDRWLKPDKNRRYIIAADVATGTGASNSSVSIGDATTREKVGEFASAGLKPEQFARFCIALGYWFHGLDQAALMIWEANGPGRIFGDYVLSVNYPRIHWREHTGRPKPEHAGWWSTTETRRSLLGEYREALTSERYINRSVIALEETRHYTYQGQDIAHSAAGMTDDPTGARANHADRVIADALLWLAMGGNAAVEQQKQNADATAPVGSFAHRRLEAERARSAQDYW